MLEVAALTVLVLLAWAACAAALFVLFSSVFIVNESQTALVLNLGKVVRSDLKPGLHFKWPLVEEVRRALLGHLQDHYALYGEFTGVRSARKHIGWYVRSLPEGEAFRMEMNGIEDSATQLDAVGRFFDALAERTDRLPVPSAEPHARELLDADA